MTYEQEQLMQDLIRRAFDEPISGNPIGEGANLIQLAVDLKLERAFKEELIRDLESEIKEHGRTGFWWNWLTDEDTDQDMRPDAMTESKERKLNS